jgi:hypothetical protein
MELYLSGCRLNDGKYLILVSSEFYEKPHEQYCKRWGIESLFGALKSGGFNLEDTHLKDAERLSRLLGYWRWPSPGPLSLASGKQVLKN